MLQQDHSGDFVIATGQADAVRERAADTGPAISLHGGS